MYKLLAGWFFGVGLLADVVVIILKCMEWIDWSWWLIIAIPFAVALAGTLCFAIIYGLIKFLVTLIIITTD